MTMSAHYIPQSPIFMHFDYHGAHVPMHENPYKESFYKNVQFIEKAIGLLDQQGYKTQKTKEKTNKNTAVDNESLSSKLNLSGLTAFSAPSFLSQEGGFARVSFSAAASKKDGKKGN
jgi:hypothetical protein